ncbi:MAG: hypothetical protein AABY26_07090, partial [Nanoarchaeota archaeon]
YGAALVPWLYLFLFKSLREPQKLGYAILAAVTLALQFYSGMIQFFMYDALMVPFFYLFFLYPEKNSVTGRREWGRPLLKMGFFCVLIFTLTFGLIAPKLLPNMDYIAISARQMGLPTETFPGLFKDPHNLWTYLVQGENGWVNDLRGSIGLIPFLLALFSLKLLKTRKEVKFFWVMILIALALVSATPFYQLIMRIPGFANGWFTSRFLVYYTLPLALLSGLGTMILVDKVSEKVNLENIHSFVKRGSAFLQKNKLQILFLFILLMVFVNVKFFNPELRMEQGIPHDGSIPALSYLENKTLSEEPFRVTNSKEIWLEKEVAYYYLPYGLEGLYGYDGTLVWIPEYVVALHSRDYLWKVRSIFNTKYFLSSERVNNTTLPGLKLVFGSNESCSTCRPTWVGGPFVYENSEALPRASFFQKAILVVGDKYGVIINSTLSTPEFNPKKHLLVEEASISDKNASYLSRYDTIILAYFNLRGLPQQELRQYKNNGGKIFPNVFNMSSDKKYNLSDLQSEIGDLMNASKEELVPVKHLIYKNNERAYDIQNFSNGFLVLSEKFYMFPNDWKESQGRELLKADGGITAIWIDSSPPKTITLKYYPATLKIGLLLLALAILWIIVLLFLQKIYAEKITALFSGESESGKSLP